jgi:hypothetical protein
VGLDDLDTSCSPIVVTGFSDVIGSWKIIATWRPRRSRIASSLRWSRSIPSNVDLPADDRPAGLASSRKMASEVTLLPQPDSPTIPSSS